MPAIRRAELETWTSLQPVMSALYYRVLDVSFDSQCSVNSAGRFTEDIATFTQGLTSSHKTLFLIGFYDECWLLCWPHLANPAMTQCINISIISVR